MFTSAVALLCGALFRLGPAAADFSGSGLCIAERCLYTKSDDFHGAQTTCGSLRGDLANVLLESDRFWLEKLATRVSGRYWIQPPRSQAGGLCDSINLGRGLMLSQVQCTDELDGVLCQLNADEVCGPFVVEDGTDVNYTLPLGLEMMDEETFPAGTTAVTGTSKSGEPNSKHVCLSVWITAPWTCEVMAGGCDHSCTPQPDRCSCDAGYQLHPNGFTCFKPPCTDCALRCENGYERSPDGKNCVDVNECETGDPCTAEGEECANTHGGYVCRCAYDFEVEDGVCVNLTICSLCEHMDCQKVSGVYQCVCKKGFRVSPKDPTKCEQFCTEKECPSLCIPRDAPDSGPPQCFCPEGYVTDDRINSTICTDMNECEMEEPCDHMCENLYGGYRCSCRPGFEQQNITKCVQSKVEEVEDEVEVEDEDGSGTVNIRPVGSTEGSPQSVSLPSYIKTGSVLGITVFLGLCAALLFLLCRKAHRRCGRFELPAYKHPDLDIYYLHQVTAETYKRLSFDKQCKIDAQRL